jgi:hypothetical protein
MKGFFCSVLSVLVAVTMLFFLFATIQTKNRFSDAVASAIELEQLSFARFQIEENIASVIEETMREELAKHNTDSVILNMRISDRLEKLLKRFEEHFGCDLYITDGFNRFKLEGLNELSSTIVSEVENELGKGYYAEYVFTGGLLKNKRVVCELKEGNATALASILPGYTIRVIHIG